MAVVQLSRIKIRRGSDEDIDRVLFQEGELGFTTDTGRLFIGSGNVDPTKKKKNTDPHNIEVLTELTSVAELTKYNYLYRDIEHPEFPTELSRRGNTDYMQFLQEKLDESVSVKTYGAVGNFNPKTGFGVDDTIAIRRAAIDVTNPNVAEKRSLHFPAGFYNITRPLVIPPHSTWIGDGVGKTVIFMTDPNQYCVARTILDISVDDIEEFDHNVIFENGDGIDVPEFLQMFNSVKESPDTVKYLNFHGITFVFTGFDLNSFQRQSPQEDFAVLKIEHTKNVNFWNCSMEGNWTCASDQTYDDFVNNVTTNDPTVRQSFDGIVPNVGVQIFKSWQRSNINFSSDPEFNKMTNSEKYLPRRDIIAVLIDSFAVGDTARTENIYFYGCDFKYCTFGLYITDNVKNVTMISCLFEHLYKGISLNDNPSVLNSELSPIDLELVSPNFNEGPKNVKVTHSRFDYIKDTAFLVARNEVVDEVEDIYYGHTSSYNSYDRVGNTQCGAFTTPGVPNIIFELGTSGNVSIGDTFLYDGETPDLRISYSTDDSNLIINAFDGSFIPGSSQFPGAGSQVNTTDGLVIQNNRTDWTDFIGPIEFNTGLANVIYIEYSLIRGEDRYRVGTFKILTTGHEDGTNWNEDYIESSPDPAIIPIPLGTGVIFRVFFDAAGNTVKLQYRSSDLPSPGTGLFKYTSHFFDGTLS